MSVYSLWRGGTLLGRFVEREPVMHHDKRVGAAGILEPSEAFVGVASMMQTRTTIFAGRPVFQHPMEPMLLGMPPLPRDGTKSHVELQPLSDDEARGVPPEHIFEIRDARGTVIDTNMVRLQLWAIPDDVDPAKYEAIGLSDTSRQIWRVSFASHTNPPPNEELNTDRLL